MIFELWFVTFVGAHTVLGFRNLNNYFDFHVCLSIRPCVCPSVCPKKAPFPAVAFQNVTNKSCLVCVQSEKYASWATLTPQLDCCCRGEAKVRILNFKTTWVRVSEGQSRQTAAT